VDPLPACDELAYYVDEAAGLDSSSGSNEAPWQSLSHARNTAPGGATICVRTGDYGQLSETTAPAITERQVIRAAPGEAPTLSGISIDYGSAGAAHLTLSGFAVRGTTGAVVRVENASGVHLIELDVSAEKWAVGGVGVTGIAIRDSQDTVVAGTKVSGVHRAMQVGGSDRTSIVGNCLVATAGSGIQYLAGNTEGHIACNQITGADYTPYPQDPDAVDDPHASIISFRSGNVVLSGNHLHGMGSSSGIMFYEPDAAGGEDAYDDILIDNNAIYDVINVYGIRFYNLGSNVEVRNNTVFPGLRIDTACNGSVNDARYRYNTAIIVHSRAAGATGIRLYNNVFVGIVSVADEHIEAERHNYAWSWSGWVTDSPSGTSHIVTSAYLGCGNHDPLFEDGSFFSAPLDPTFPGRDVHRLDLASGSAGINFGDPAVQPDESLGSVTGAGFIVPDGAARDAGHHSVGAYEHGP
jgi:hypothetical protein